VGIPITMINCLIVRLLNCSIVLLLIIVARPVRRGWDRLYKKYKLNLKIMFLIIGLGNPGDQYKNTRHNVGFGAVEYLAKEFNLAEFKKLSKFKAEISEGKIGGEKVVMAKPQTFMNASGEAVTALKNYYKVPVENMLVIYDELDLPFGKIRVRSEGSSAGHRGIESIMEKTGTDKFWRIRIGTRNEKAEKMPADKFVLSKFSLIERLNLKKKVWPEVKQEVEKIVLKR
jgi:peptidyl-tRNA hydrolase, PTH1 family